MSHQGSPGGSEGKESAHSVGDLDWEDPLEEGMATHSRFLCGESPWTEEPGGYSPWGRKELDLSRIKHRAIYCEMIPAIKVINGSITSHSSSVVRPLKFNSFSKLRVSITVLAIVNQDVCLRFPEFLHPAYLKLCILGAKSHFPIPHP